MSQARNAQPNPFSEFIRQQAESGALEQAQRNALGKQYNMSIRMVVTETSGNKPFFDSGDVTWSGVPYPIVVITEKALVALLEQFTDLGASVGTGEPQG